MLRGPRDVRNGLDRHAIVVSLKGHTQRRQLLMRLQSPEALIGLDHAGRDPAQGIPASHQRVTSRVTRQMVPIMFSAMLV